MFVWILLLGVQQIFGSADRNKTPIKGKLCVPYCKPFIVEQLGPYKAACLKAFKADHDPSYRQQWLTSLGLLKNEIDWRLKNKANIAAHEQLNKLWIPVKAFSSSSNNWAVFGHKEINDKSQKIGQAFPHYMPLIYFLDPDLDESKPIKLILALGNHEILAELQLDQGEYKHKWDVNDNDANEATFATTKGMIIAILRKHWADCKMQIWKLPPKKTIDTVTIKNQLGFPMQVAKDEFILSKIFGYSLEDYSLTSDDSATDEYDDSMEDDWAEPTTPNISPSNSCSNLAALASYLDHK